MNVFDFDLDAAIEKAFIGFPSQLVSPMLGKHEVEGALDRLRLSIGTQELLDPQKFDRVQAEMFMSNPCFCSPLQGSLTCV